MLFRSFSLRKEGEKYVMKLDVSSNSKKILFEIIDVHINKCEIYLSNVKEEELDEIYAEVGYFKIDDDGIGFFGSNNKNPSMNLNAVIALENLNLLKSKIMDNSIKTKHAALLSLVGCEQALSCDVEYNIYDAVSHCVNLETADRPIVEKKARIKSSQSALDSRYASQRIKWAKLKSVAKKMWEEGDNRMHHEMKKFLIEEYKDENGKYPFVNLSERSILNTLKEVAKALNREDLISGKKIKK